MRWRRWRWLGSSIIESRPLTGFQMLFTCHTVSPYSHTHIWPLFLCLSACEPLILITHWSAGRVPSHHTMSNLIRNSKRVGGSTREREAAVWASHNVDTRSTLKIRKGSIESFRGKNDVVGWRKQMSVLPLRVNYWVEFVNSFLKRTERHFG